MIDVCIKVDVGFLKPTIYDTISSDEKKLYWHLLIGMEV